MIILFFSDCWHSWNTAKRVAEKCGLQFGLGWFRDGIDAWQDKGSPVEFLQQPLQMPLSPSEETGVDKGLKKVGPRSFQQGIGSLG